jgi:hypothetical protein
LSLKKELLYRSKKKKKHKKKLKLKRKHKRNNNKYSYSTVFICWVYEYIFGLYECIVWLYEFTSWLYECISCLYECISWLYEFIVWLYEPLFFCKTLKSTNIKISIKTTNKVEPRPKVRSEAKNQPKPCSKDAPWKIVHFRTSRIEKGALCAELRPFYCSIRIRAPMLYMIFDVRPSSSVRRLDRRPSVVVVVRPSFRPSSVRRRRPSVRRRRPSSSVYRERQDKKTHTHTHTHTQTEGEIRTKKRCRRWKKKMKIME